MRIAVIGAGIAGTLTAHYLASRGLAATVYDAGPQPASGTSAANGAQLSYSFCEPMNDRGLLPRLPGILLGRDPAFRIGLQPEPDFLRWGLRFLRQCTSAQGERSTHGLLTLSRRTAKLMPPLLEQHLPPELWHQTGKLVLLSASPSPALERSIRLKQEYGFPVRLVSTDEAISLEPSLSHWPVKPVAGVYCESDQAADAARFCRALGEHLMQRQTRFAFNDPVLSLEQDGARGWRVVTASATQRFDALVLCNGLGASALLKPLGIRLPLLAMNGYSLTLPATADSPRTSMTAQAQRIVFSPFGHQVRIAGFADMNNNDPRGDRPRQLLATAQALAPAAADYGAPDPLAWSGSRVMTPDSLPIVGRLAAPGLFSNLGHGMLGWTLGAACAEAVAQAVADSA